MYVLYCTCMYLISYVEGLQTLILNLNLPPFSFSMYGCCCLDTLFLGIIHLGVRISFSSFFLFGSFLKVRFLNLAMLALWEKKIIPRANFSLRSFFFSFPNSSSVRQDCIFERNILDILILVKNNKNKNLTYVCGSKTISSHPSKYSRLFTSPIKDGQPPPIPKARPQPGNPSPTGSSQPAKLARRSHSGSFLQQSFAAPRSWQSRTIFHLAQLIRYLDDTLPGVDPVRAAAPG